MGLALLAPVTVVLLVILSSCSGTHSTSGATGTSAAPSSAASPSGGSSAPSAPSSSGSASPTPAPTTTTPPRPVHVSLFEGDGRTYGVGFAIMALFNRMPTDSRPFADAVTVRVNGRLAHGAWYWQSPEIPGYKAEALYRLQSYWPAHAHIVATMPLKGRSAGKGLAYDDNLSLSVQTGAAHVSTVDNATHMMTVRSDGKVVKQMPVSLGSADHPTYRGTKVVMQKGEDLPGTHRPRPKGEVRMVSRQPGDQYDLLVPWSVRVTNSGEFIHSASWNTGNIGARNTSHGCTNLDVAAAQWFYNFSLVGDVVQYPDASGPTQPSWDGWGWWNIPWSTWQGGGLLHSQ